jgi:hypothetical protein
MKIRLNFVVFLALALLCSGCSSLGSSSSSRSGTHAVYDSRYDPAVPIEEHSFFTLPSYLAIIYITAFDYQKSNVGDETNWYWKNTDSKQKLIIIPSGKHTLGGQWERQITDNGQIKTYKKDINITHDFQPGVFYHLNADFDQAKATVTFSIEPYAASYLPDMKKSVTNKLGIEWPKEITDSSTDTGTEE